MNSPDLFSCGLDTPQIIVPTGASDEWFTPRWLLHWLPPILLDPCWSPQSHITHGPAALDPITTQPLSIVADDVLDVRAGQNGLTADWSASVSRWGWQHKIIFVNPPYSDCAAWVAKCAAEARRCRGVPIVALIPAKPGEVYWHEHVWGESYAVGFLRGRVPFDTVAGPGRDAGTFGSALVVWGGDLLAVHAMRLIDRRACQDNRRPKWTKLAA